MRRSKAFEKQVYQLLLDMGYDPTEFCIEWYSGNLPSKREILLKPEFVVQNEREAGKRFGANHLVFQIYYIPDPELFLAFYQKSSNETNLRYLPGKDDTAFHTVQHAPLNSSMGKDILPYISKWAERVEAEVGPNVKFEIETHRFIRNLLSVDFEQVFEPEDCFAGDEIEIVTESLKKVEKAAEMLPLPPETKEKFTEAIVSATASLPTKPKGKWAEFFKLELVKLAFKGGYDVVTQKKFWEICAELFVDLKIWSTSQLEAFDGWVSNFIPGG